MGHFNCLERFYNAQRAPWEVFLRVAGDSRLGVRAEFRSALAGGLGHWLYSLELGEMRPAHYLPFVPTTHNGTAQSGDTGALYGGVRWLRLLDSQFVAWTIPNEPIGDGDVSRHDRLTVWYRQSATDVINVAIAFDGTNWVSQGTINTAGTLDYHASATLPIIGGTLQPGSKIRLSVDGGEGTVDPQCVVLWQSDGECSDSDMRFMPEGQPLIEEGACLFNVIAKANQPVSHWRNYGGWKYYARAGYDDGVLIETVQQVLRPGDPWSPSGAGYTSHDAYFLDVTELSVAGTIYDPDSDEILINTFERYALPGEGLNAELSWSILCEGTTIQTVEFGRLSVPEVCHAG